MPGKARTKGFLGDGGGVDERNCADAAEGGINPTQIEVVDRDQPRERANGFEEHGVGAERIEPDARENLDIVSLPGRGGASGNGDRCEQMVLPGLT